MKKYIFFLTILNHTIYISCSHPSEPLLQEEKIYYTAQCNKQKYTTKQEISPDKGYTNIYKLFQITQIVLNKANKTIVTFASHNDPKFKKLLIQITDPHEKTKLLITHQILFGNNETNTEKRSIWDCVADHTNSCNIDPFTTANISVLFANHSKMQRLLSIILCTKTDRVDIYPESLLPSIPQHLQLLDTEARTEFLSTLDPRVKESLTLDNRFVTETLLQK